MIEEEIPNLLTHFTAVADPRAHNVCHKLEEVLAIAICAVICGADSFTEIEQYGQAKRDGLAKFLELKNGVPSHDTFRRVFMLLEAEAWQGVFFEWTRKLVLKETASPTEVVAVDGKWSRASGLHTVSAWAVEHHVVLAQQQVADKTNEATVIPELLEVLDIAGTTVTINAAGTQNRLPGQSENTTQTMSWRSKQITSTCSRTSSGCLPSMTAHLTGLQAARAAGA